MSGMISESTLDADAMLERFDAMLTVQPQLGQFDDAPEA